MLSYVAGARSIESENVTRHAAQATTRHATATSLAGETPQLGWHHSCRTITDGISLLCCYYALDARRFVLFIDDLHNVTGPNAQQGGGVMDASVLLKPLLGRGELRCIGGYNSNVRQTHTASLGIAVALRVPSAWLHGGHVTHVFLC
jgi:hypothetical protein